MIVNFLILNFMVIQISTGNTVKVINENNQILLRFPSQDIQDFEELVIQTDVFVDKSILIKQFLNVTEKGPIVINQPIGWGKSLNLDMLRRFFEIEVDEEGKEIPDEQKFNKKLFLGGSISVENRTKILSKLKIAEHVDIVENFLGKFPVIFFSLKNIFDFNFIKMKSLLAEKLMNLYSNKYSYLKKYCQKDDKTVDDLNKTDVQSYFDQKISPEWDLSNALYLLSRLLEVHFKQKVIVLIDDYDETIQFANQKFENQTEQFTEYLDTIRNMLGAVLKGNPHLGRGCLTGIFPYYDFGPRLDNLRHYFIPHEEFSEFYGFIEEEVQQLLGTVRTETEIEEMRLWYGGFYIGGHSIYTPISVLQCLQNGGKLQRYSVLTHRLDFLAGKTVSTSHFRSDVQKFFTNNTRPFVYSVHSSKKDDYRAHHRELADPTKDIDYFLLFGGFMAVKKGDKAGHLLLNIPNYEAQFAYEKIQLRWTTYVFGFQPGWQIAAANYLGNYKFKEFEKELQNITKTTNILNHEIDLEKGDDGVLRNGIMLSIAFSFPPEYFLVGDLEPDMVGKIELLFVPSRGSSRKDGIILQFTSILPINDSLTEFASVMAKRAEIPKYGVKLKQFAFLNYIYKVFVVFERGDVGVGFHKVLSYDIKQLSVTSKLKDTHLCIY